MSLLKANLGRPCFSLLSFRDIFICVHFAHISGIINPEAVVPQGASDVMD